MSKLLPFRSYLESESGGEATNTLAASPVLPGKIRYYTMITAVDEDNAVTSIQMKAGVITAEREFYYAGTTAAGTRRRNVDPEIAVREGERLIVVFAGATDGDNLRVELLGYEVDA